MKSHLLKKSAKTHYGNIGFTACGMNTITKNFHILSKDEFNISKNQCSKCKEVAIKSEENVKIILRNDPAKLRRKNA
jgi:hypothetical protein